MGEKLKLHKLHKRGNVGPAFGGKRVGVGGPFQNGCRGWGGFGGIGGRKSGV